jgi:hypothetical protein
VVVHVLAHIVKVVVLATCRTQQNKCECCEM